VDQLLQTVLNLGMHWALSDYLYWGGTDRDTCSICCETSRNNAVD